MKIVFILPSRERAVAFFQTLDNIIENVVKPDYEIICALDVDDLLMNNDAAKERLSTYEKVTAYWGYSKNKVDAINRECNKIPDDTDIIILMSDDQRFIIKGFDDIIRVDMQKYFPDRDGVLHYDSNNPMGKRVIIMSIMGFNYFRIFNYIYSPEFESWYCDSQFTECAKILKKYKFIPRTEIFSHSHPAWETANNDALYTRNNSLKIRQKDKDTYFRNLANNFGL